MTAVSVDIEATRDAAAQLRSIAAAASSDAMAGGTVSFPGSGMAASSLAQLLLAEHRCTARVQEQVHRAAGRLEDVVSAVLAADRFEGAAP